MSRLEVPTRIPPHNLDAERAVLGAILLEGRETLPRMIELLKPSDFYTEAHRLIYESMLALFNRSEPVDVLTLTEELRRGDQLEIVGGPAALALLVEQGSISAYLSSYASIVRDMAVLRELIQTSSHIIAQAFEAKEDVQTLVDDAERRIFSLAERRLEGSALPIGKILRNTFEYIERLYERKEHVTGVATGFEKLDLETSGFQPSDFIIIAGRPSMGRALCARRQRGRALAADSRPPRARRWIASSSGLLRLSPGAPREVTTGASSRARARTVLVSPG